MNKYEITLTSYSLSLRERVGVRDNLLKLFHACSQRHEVLGIFLVFSVSFVVSFSDYCNNIE